MKLCMAFASCLLLGFMVACQVSEDVPAELVAEYPLSLDVTVQNPTKLMRNDELIALDIATLTEKAEDFNPGAFVVVWAMQELSSQASDVDGDGTVDKIFFVADFEPDEEKTVAIRYADTGAKPRDYEKRTQAELSHKYGGRFEKQKYVGGQFQNVTSVRVPAEHTDHSEFFRYEGPGWESDKIGYRYYLDWRNATDIFGKKVTDMVLQHVGLDGFDSYHEMADWGMDILKVGESLGIGSIAMWHEGKANRVAVTDSVRVQIAANGPVYSHIRTDYWGWQIADNKHGLASHLSISAGSRMTRHKLSVTDAPDNLCTGIVKHPQAQILRPAIDSQEWSYLATYGKQSLAEDNLGMAILYRTEDLVEITEDEHSHVVVLHPNNGSLVYYFLGAWQQEPDGIQTRAEFEAYLDDVITRLNQPIEIQF